MLHQLRFELLETRVERAPRGTGFGRRREARGELAYTPKVRAVVIMLLHHHPDRHVYGASASSSADRGKQHLLLFHHVLLQVSGQLFQQQGQSCRTARLFSVNALDASRGLDEHREIRAERLVISVEDEVDEVG